MHHLYFLTGKGRDKFVPEFIINTEMSVYIFQFKGMSDKTVCVLMKSLE